MKYLKTFWPILIILLVWFVFSSPFFLKGLVPFPSDYLVNNVAPWSAYPGFSSPVKNAATPDVVGQIFPWKSLTIDVWKSGSIPLWNPYSFSGTPLLANYQSAVFSPINLIYFVLPFVTAWSLQVLLAPLLAGVFTYIFLRSLRISQSGSLVSSTAFMFCGFMVTWMDYGTLTYAILFLPLALFAIEKYYENKKWYYLTLLAATVPLSFFSGHFQISIYFLLIILAYLVFKYIETKNLKSFILNLSSLFLGLMIAAPQLLPSIELYAEAVRSGVFIKTEVIPWGYLPTFISPDFFGNPVTRNNWFGHYAEWNAFVGLIAPMLGFYSLRQLNSKVWFFACAAVAAILLSFQTPLIDLLITLKIPVLSTSAASRIIVLFSFSAAVLAGFGFDNLIRDIREGAYRGIAFLVGGFLLIFIGLWVIAYTNTFLDLDKAQIALSNLKLPSIIFFIFIISLFIVSFVKGRRAVAIITIVIIFLCAADSLRFATKWMPFQPANLVYPEVKISRFLSQIAGKDRVFGNIDAAASITYKIPSVEGYDPLYIQRYGTLIEAASDGLYHISPRSGVALSKHGKYTPEIINLLGIKYILEKKSDDRKPWTFPIWEYSQDQFKIVYEDEVYRVFENVKASPRAIVVGNFIIEHDNQNILNRMFKNGVDLQNTAILEENPQVGSSDSTGSAKILKYEPNMVQILTDSTDSAILVLTDPYYPGWKATIKPSAGSTSSPQKSSDQAGSPAKIYRTDYALRGVVVPQGKNIVEFKYQPDSFRNGLIIAVIGIVGLLGLSKYSLMSLSRKRDSR